jgi:predicted PurR-regulated permease PerM
VPISEQTRTDEPVAVGEKAKPDDVRTSLTNSNTALAIIAICAVILLLRYMQEVFIPFVLAGLTFYALDPAVDWLQRWHIPRTVGAALMLLVLIGGVGALGYSLRDNVEAVANDLPAATRKLQSLLRSRSNQPAGAMDKLQEAATQIDKTAAEAAGRQQAPPGVVRVQVERPPVLQLTEYIRWGPAGIVSLFGGVLMVLFLAYFLLVTNDLFKRKLVEISGTTLTRKKVTVQVLNQIAAQIESFLKVQIFTSTVVGVSTWLALWWLGVANAAVWGLCAGLFNSIPYFGPMIVSGALAVIAFVQFGTVYKAATVAGVAMLITTLEGWVLTPLLMGRVAQINTVAIFAGLLFWSWMWGIWGLLLAVPMMMCLKAVCDGVEDLRPLGKFLGD